MNNSEGDKLPEKVETGLDKACAYYCDWYEHGDSGKAGDVAYELVTYIREALSATRELVKAQGEVTEGEREDLAQFVRELDADLFVQCPIGPNESDQIKAERVRVRKNFDLLFALIAAPRPKVTMGEIADFFLVLAEASVASVSYCVPTEDMKVRMLTRWLLARNVAVEEVKP